MNERLQKARRLHAVQSEIDRLADWRLIEIARERALLDERRRTLVAFLDAESAFAAPFAVTMMQRLHRLEERRATLKEEMEALSRRRLEERRRLRRAQQMVRNLTDETRRLDDKQALLDAVESAAGAQVCGKAKV
ncbi:hypothetical protein [Methylocapsa palsarum]|uniref:Flagellar FliJ protein n=1 Tax=Methylocapsa palsarum TaxID=1612308 RepID=A0A1I3WAV4_9HYPH|nr:hypothetical protein [Methylocapsa palsarum]SFK04530.1 hypothetical protein SAMN05444581_101470 [Methylocapsa palsarum]